MKKINKALKFKLAHALHLLNCGLRKLGMDRTPKGVLFQSKVLKSSENSIKVNLQFFYRGLYKGLNLARDWSLFVVHFLCLPLDILAANLGLTAKSKISTHQRPGKSFQSPSPQSFLGFKLESLPNF